MHRIRLMLSAICLAAAISQTGSPAMAAAGARTNAPKVQDKKDKKSKTAQSTREAETTKMDRAFVQRDWPEVGALLLMGKLSPRERSLAANAYWVQGRWADSLKLIESLQGTYPASVEPFAKLLKVLGLERLKRSDEARQCAKDLYAEAQGPALVRYFAAYAASRLTDSVAEKVQWYHRMVPLAGDSPDRQKTPLLGLAMVDSLSPAEGLKLLSIDRQNKKALAAALNAPASAEKSYRVGYAYYLQNQYKEATQWLKSFKPGVPFGESGSYYLAMSMTRNGESAQSIPIFEKLIFMPDGNYTARSLKRLSYLLSTSVRPQALNVVLKASTDKDPQRSAAALNVLANDSSYPNRDEARRQLLTRFPNSAVAAELLWRQGWEKWQQGNIVDALARWTLADPQNEDGQARLLYWRALGEEKLGHTAVAQKMHERLLKNYGLSIYSFYVKAGGSLTISEGALPAQFRRTERTELERWGFMAHARMQLQERGDASSQIAAAAIAMWLGQEGQAYADVRALLPQYLKGSSISRPLLKLAFPRPYRTQVEAMGTRYGVDPLLIWAIMRQESAFDPNATSWVGASGLMQLMPATAAGEAKRIGLKRYSSYNTSDNIAMGTSHISGLIARFKRYDWAVAAYNAGGGNVNKWNRQRGTWEVAPWTESVPFDETRNYVKKVLANYQIYQKLYGVTVSIKAPQRPESDDIPSEAVLEPEDVGPAPIPDTV